MISFGRCQNIVNCYLCADPFDFLKSRHTKGGFLHYNGASIDTVFLPGFIYICLLKKTYFLSIPTENNTSRTGFSLQKNLHVFGLLWLITAILYIPTAKAGWVIDAIGWIYDMKHHDFLDFINRVQSTSESFYQLFAIHYYICYKLWGMNMLMWSLFYLTVHAVNATLLFMLCRNIFRDSGLQKSASIALCGALLYVVCPHVSEVIVWKACFHYLMGFTFILLSLLMIQKYQNRQQSKYIWTALFVFCLSAFGLEIFYLTPFLGLMLALFYRFGLGYTKDVFRKTLTRFFIPQLLLFGLYFIGLFAYYKFLRPHGTVTSNPVTVYLSKPPKYVFHILLLGRYFPMYVKGGVYAFCESVKGLILFYSIVVAIVVYTLARFKKIDNYSKVIFLLFVWVMMFIAFLMGVGFPSNLNLYVFYDRYTYFADGFVYTMMAMIIARYVNKYVAIPIFILYATVNIYFTVKLNVYWKHSAYIDNRLLRDVPDAGDKTIILLNIPENMNGIAMIGAQPEGEFKAVHDLLVGPTIKNTIYDGASYNMLTDKDGAHVNVINDSTVLVTLNQWGTWWWYGGFGAYNYQTPDYTANFDMGHTYKLTLKHPSDRYLLLYEVGPNWKIVNMKKKNADQY